MAFFQSAVGVLQTLVIALGAAHGRWRRCFDRNYPCTFAFRFVLRSSGNGTGRSSRSIGSKEVTSGQRNTDNI